MSGISSNFGPFNALLNLQRADKGQAAAHERLSSGTRINSSKDAPADLATANQLRSEIKAMRDLRQSTFDGVSVTQVADATLGEAVNLIYRAMELAEWSASGASGPDNGLAKQARNAEYQELLVTLDQLNENTEVNDTPLFGATGTTMVVNMGTKVNTSSLDQLQVTTTPFDSVTLALAGTDVLTGATSDAVLAQLRPALYSLTSQQANMGVLQNRLERNINQINDQIDAHYDQESRIRDTNIADETVNLTTFQILNQSNVATISQANLTTEAVFQLLG